jgi:hypothetical protein
MPGDDFVVGIDDWQLDEIELFKRTLEVPDLFRRHRTRVFNIGHEVADLSLDCMPLLLLSPFLF